MKNLATNQSHIVYSRMKEVWEGFLSMFDDKKYNTSDEEIDLPAQLQDSLQVLTIKAKNFEANGITTEKVLEQEQTNSKNIKVQKPRVKNLTEQQIDTMEKLTNKSINISDKEIGEDR